MKPTHILKLPPAESIDQKLIAEAAEALRRGELVIIPTDTVYGVAADRNNPEAVAALGLIKNRPGGKPIPILASDRMQIEKLNARFGACGEKLARRFWPGPLTLVLPVTGGWEGFRIPDHAVTIAVIKAAGGMLRVTSANLSGEAPALTAGQAVRALGNAASLALDAGPVKHGAASTVVKITDGQVEILREGAIARDEIDAACKGA